MWRDEREKGGPCKWLLTCKMFNPLEPPITFDVALGVAPITIKLSCQSQVLVHEIYLIKAIA